MNEGSDAIIQMENDVDSYLSDAESQTSDRTAVAIDVEELHSDSNVQYDDLKTEYKGVQTLLHNETDIMNIGETKYKVGSPVENSECEDIQKIANILSADKKKGEENEIDLIDDTIKDMDVVREREDTGNAFSTVKGIRKQNERDLIRDMFRDMGLRKVKNILNESLEESTQPT